MAQRIRVLMTKIGFDGHDRGLRLIARTFRDAGMEVIYTGPYQTVEQVTGAAIQENVDVIGISSLGHDHVLIPKMMKLLRNRGGGDIIVCVGGVIPDDDAKELIEAGVVKIFHPGANLNEIVSFIEEEVSKRKE